MTDIIGFINIFSGLIQLGMGFFVLLSDLRSKEKRYYFLSALFLGLWSLSIYFYSNPLIFDTTIWLKIVYTMAYCMTLGLILFARVYPKESEKQFNIFFVFIALSMFALSILMWKSDLIVVDTVNIPLKYNTIAQMGSLYVLYGIPELVTAIYIIWYYMKQTKIYSGIEKRQLQHYVAGGIIMLLPVILFDFIFPLLFKDTSYYKISTLGNSIWTVIVGYSILTTRFLDTKVVLGNVMGTFLKSIFITIFLLLTLFVLEPLWNIDISYSGIFKLLTISIVSTILLEYTFGKIQQFLSEKYVYSNYNPVRNLRMLTNKNSEILDINVILGNLLEMISKSLKTEFVSVILFDKNGLVITTKEQGKKEIAFNDIVETLNVWKNLNSNRILVYSELRKDKRAGRLIIDKKRESILTFMSKNSIEIIFSLKEFEKFDGAVLIGQNIKKNAYTVGDIDFLDSIVQNTHISLVRAFLYLELKSFNKSLQLKVDEQTKELQIKIKELEEARKKEADMIDIMGHELRTPATVVKLNATLLEKFIDSNPLNFKKYLNRIKQAIDTEIGLINTLLTSAKLEGNKVEIKFEKVNIKDEIYMSLHGHEQQSIEKRLILDSEIPNDLPLVYADRVRVSEVLNNLISNAIKYTTKGGVRVYATHDDNNVTISILDTGKGISQEDLPKLGGKFFRVDNYLDSDIVRPGGTGLGLYITFRLIKLMNGEVEVKSDIGKGSMFTFSLPIYKSQVVTKTNSIDRFTALGLKK